MGVLGQDKGCGRSWIGCWCLFPSPEPEELWWVCKIEVDVEHGMAWPPFSPKSARPMVPPPFSKVVNGSQAMQEPGCGYAARSWGPHGSLELSVWSFLSRWWVGGRSCWLALVQVLGPVKRLPPLVV